ncbi:MAG: sugar phosphate isomerase/epimerase [Erysipelotrichaceae bacterium]|nr:sugar phosphate isomerase/epimerase [Erysipelotrichaceae bacterium]
MNKEIKISVQAFSLREYLSKDLETTIKKIREIGFDGIEAMLVPMKKQGKVPTYLWSKGLLDQAMTLCKENGLEVFTAHMGFGIGSIRLPVKQVADYINDVSKKYGVRYFIFSGLFKDEKSAKSCGQYLKKIAELTKDSNARILYHNHDLELLPYSRNGICAYPMDIFLENAGEDVGLQLDIGWADFAKDDIFFYERYEDRILSIHCKDFYEGFKNYPVKGKIPAESFSPIGSGKVHTHEIISRFLNKDLSFHHIAIDQDLFSGDAYDQLKTGYENLTSFISEPLTTKISRNTEIKEHKPLDKERLSLMTFTFEADRLFKQMSIDDIISLASENEIHMVDLMNIKGKDLPAYIDALTRHNVKVNAYICNLPFLSEKSKYLEQMYTQMSIANALKAKLFMIVPYYRPSELKEAVKLGRQETIQRLIEGFKATVAEGKRRELEVAFETTPHDEICLSSAEDCKTVLDNVEGLKLIYDTANMLPSGEDPYSYYEKLKDYIVHVHLKDVLLTKAKPESYSWSEFTKDGRKMNCCIWGQGEIDLRRIYDRMIEDGYEGTFAIEYSHPNSIARKEVHSKQLKKHFEI